MLSHSRQYFQETKMKEGLLNFHNTPSAPRPSYLAGIKSAGLILSIAPNGIEMNCEAR